MPFSHWPKVVALALLPMAAFAQQAREPSPSDPNAPVPAPGYLSAFSTYQPAGKEQSTPDAVWFAANEQVSGQDAHAGHEGGMAMPGKTSAAAPVNPGAAHAGADAHHGSHHH